ncbi:synaptic vesicle glycoprotein 2B [Drosophila subpulchrella]|uniref:synaptic vesicle glycoprotein 2B n=1 Tax=Drosophila subpulchrella TaxID=1486046 RepID=UPI0018A12B55|nr:synaptic vesicle glycoprotein 2B [Drosophila subpulchrella]
MPTMDVDTALLTMGYGCGQVIIFIVSFFVYMYSVSESMSAGYLVILTSCDFATSRGEKTLLANSLLGGMVASGLFIGLLADRYGRKFIIRIGLIGGLCFSMISAFMPELYSLSVMRMIVGIFLSGVASLQVGFLTEFHAPKWRPLAVTLCSQSQSAALIYCPLMGMSILPQNFSVTLSSSYDMRAWRFLMFLIEIPGWIALLGICLVPETPYFLMSVRREEKAIAALQWICRMNKKKWEDFDISIIEVPRTTILREGFWKNLWDESIRLFQRPYVGKFILCLTLIFGIFFVSIGLGIWFPVIRNMDNSGHNRLCELINNNPTLMKREPEVVNGTEAGPPPCNDVMSNFIDPIYYGLTYMSCFILSSLLLQCLPRKYVIALHLLIAFVLGISLNALREPTLVLIFFTLMMVLPGVLIPLATSALVDCMPTHLRGKAICMVRSLARFGGVLGSTMIGMLIRVTCDVTFNIFILVLAVCIVLAVFQPKGLKS